jgi:nitric oxide reductase activation protein
MRTEAFITFAHRYTQAIAGRGVSVTFGGKTAHTSHRHLRLPALPAGSTMSLWEAKVFKGYLDHELAHHRYTAAIRGGRLPFDRKKKPTLFHLWNVFEDVRIENLSIKEFPGTKQYLDATTEQIERDKDAQLGKTPPKGEIILEAIYREAYETHRKVEGVTWHSKTTIDQVPGLAKIKKVMENLGKITNEDEIVRLAQKVYDLLPRNVDYLQATNPDEEFTLVEVMGDTTLDLDACVQGLIELNERGHGVILLIRKIDQENKLDDKKPLRAQWDGAQILPPVSTQHDKIFVPSVQDKAEYEATRAKAAPQITSLKRMLQIYLRSRTKKAWERNLPEGDRLDDDALPNLFAGSKDLFKKRRQTQLIDTAIELVIDESGSMRGQHSRTAAIMCAEALMGVQNVKLSVCGFTTNNHRLDGKEGGRAVGIDLMLYKDYEESYQHAKGRLGAIGAHNSTPLGDAYGHAYTRILQRTETRRTLWVITDGDPQIPLADQRHNEFLLMARIHQKCKRAHIETLLLNVGKPINEKARTCADQSVMVSRYEDLPTALMAMIKDTAR